MDFWEEASYVATTFGAVALFIALWSLFVSRRQSREEFEMNYVNRYWRILDGMTGDFRFRGDAPTARDVDAMYSYVALCEDEIDLRRNGYLTNRTWRCWSGYIADVFQKDERYRHLLQNDIPDDRYPSLRDFISKYDCNDAKAWKHADPRREMSRVQRLTDWLTF